MSDFTRSITFESAYDHRAMNGGIHGVEILFLLKGDLGATQFRLDTGWYLPEVVGVPIDDLSWLRYSDALKTKFSIGGPTPVDLGYHSPKPIYDRQEPMTGDCPYIGGPCFYDVSALNAWRPFEALLRHGHDGVWTVLEDYYSSVFGSEA